jgi:hypothetical protein
MDLFEKVCEHKADKGEDMKRLDSFRQSLIVFSQAAKACRPGKAALDNPAFRQEHKAAYGLRRLDHFQPHCRLEFDEVGQ